jgi:hypothetical protein
VQWTKKPKFSPTFNKILRPYSTGKLSKPTFHLSTSTFCCLPKFVVHRIFVFTDKHWNIQISTLTCSLVLFSCADALGEWRRPSHWILLFIEDRTSIETHGKPQKPCYNFKYITGYPHWLWHTFIKKLRTCIPFMWSRRDQPNSVATKLIRTACCWANCVAVRTNTYVISSPHLFTHFLNPQSLHTFWAFSVVAFQLKTQSFGSKSTLSKVIFFNHVQRPSP